MAEYWIRVDTYIEADSLEQACHTVMDALSGVTNEAHLVDGGPAIMKRVVR
jgi:hypothetical protein